jgi:hypothetical protein
MANIRHNLKNLLLKGKSFVSVINSSKENILNGNLDKRGWQSVSAGGGDDFAGIFLSAAGITDPTITSAVYTLVNDLNGYGLWSKMKAIYPMVGGNANAHSYNLKDITKFQITWSGGLTHSSTGVLPNGTNGYGNTGLTPSLSLLQNSTSVSFYSRTNTNTGWDFGSAGGSSYSNIIAGNIRYSDIYFYPTNDTTYNITVYNGSGLGYFIQSRTGASTVSAFKNSSKLVTGTSPSASLSAYPIFLFTFNNMGSPFTYGNKECAFFSIGDGLSDTEAANLYTSIQKFQTTLNRFVGTPIYPSFDSDAQSFMTSASITDSTQQAAVNYLVTDLKSNNLWTKMKAVYPMVGGNATSHSYNLKNPSQFQITWNGGITHDSNGVLSNGINGYGNTNFNLSTNSTASNISAGIYSRTNINSGPSIGAVTATYRGLQITAKFTDNNTYYGANDFIVDGSGNYVTNTQKLFIVNREGVGTKKLYRDGIAINTATSIESVVPNLNVYLLSRNYNGATDGFDSKQLAFSFLGDTLTSVDVTNLNTIIQNYQTILNRQV